MLLIHLLFDITGPSPLQGGGGREGGACRVVIHRLIMYILANVQRTQIHTRTPCNQLCYMYRLRSHVHRPVHVHIQWYASSITVPTHAYCNVWLIDAYTYCSRGKKLCACYTTIAVCCSGVDLRINILHTPTCILYTYASPHSQEERDTCKGYAMYRRNSTYMYMYLQHASHVHSETFRMYYSNYYLHVHVLYITDVHQIM